MRNFDYLKEFPYLIELHGYCHAAEETQFCKPKDSAHKSRQALEWIVRTVYELKGVEITKEMTLFTLMDGTPFREFIDDDRLMMGANYIRRCGNNGTHVGKEVSRRQSFFTLLNLYNLVGAVLVKLRVAESFAPFDSSLIPHEPDIFVEPKPHPKETGDFIDTHSDTIKKPSPMPELNWGDISEADTRKYFIDIILDEAGWEVVETEGAVMPGKACIEVELKGMPNNAGTGYADYVLFGKNGKPLAVVEAKRTSKDPAVGKHQAELYADCLEQQYGQRPVIYYTNGYHTFVIDGLGYPSREVLGYHTEEELELLIQKRGRKDISDMSANDNITDRYYQKTAIKAVCEHFNNLHRKALLVMATGTGKTRVAVSLVDVLMRNGWVKNMLFLADRTELVNQAKKAFSSLLPSVPVCVLSDQKTKEEDKDLNARLMFSTYQTMMGRLDSDDKEFSIGRFDLVIIDEAHRSIFGKYYAIIKYFDSMTVGLTATPRDEVDRSTYDIFEMEQGEPNYSYELDEAVEDRFLVPYHGFKRCSQIIDNGITYADLSDSEKKQLDPVWEYEKAKKALDPYSEYSRDIRSNEIFKYIYNIDTIDQMLQDLMDNGLKVSSGDRIGKTIIFAANSRHARMIVERFEKLYPQFGGGFCVQIDYTVNYGNDLIEKFRTRNIEPQIAVSVDMLDTGVDVPDALNLVFFKVVKSKIKFLQMIGRGTRLSENIFGMSTVWEDGFGDMDKRCFYIFDWCGNFDFFTENPNGVEVQRTMSLTEHLFDIRTDIAFALQGGVYQSDEYARGLHDRLKDVLCKQVAKLDELHVSVRQQIEYVVKYRNPANWVYITPIDVFDLKGRLAQLIVSENEDESALKFDLIMLKIELSMVDKTVKSGKCVSKVIDIAALLKDKASIPQVFAKLPLLEEVTTTAFWADKTLQSMEMVRIEIRELVQYLIGVAKRTFDINIADVVNDGGDVDTIPTQMSYREKVFDFLKDNKELPVLRKITELEQLTTDDIKELERIFWQELGSKEDYDKYLEKHNLPCGDKVAVFIRSIIGIDRSAAMSKFSEYINGADINSMQMEYLKTILDYVCQNGDITADNIVNDAPFNEYDIFGIFGERTTQFGRYVNYIHEAVG